MESSVRSPWSALTQGQGMQGQRIPAQAQDEARVRALFERDPVAGYQIQRIEYIFNERLQKNFEESVAKMERLGELLPVVPEWRLQNREEAAEILDCAPEKLGPTDRQYAYVNFSPLFMGTKANALSAIVHLGFDLTIFKDVGWIGDAYYLSQSAQQASSKSGGPLIYAWAAYHRVYPITPKSGAVQPATYNLFYACVGQKENSSLYIPKVKSAAVAVECAVFQSEMLFPRFIVHLEPIQKLELIPPSSFSEGVRRFRSLAGEQQFLRIAFEKLVAEVTASSDLKCKELVQLVSDFGSEQPEALLKLLAERIRRLVIVESLNFLEEVQEVGQPINESEAVFRFKRLADTKPHPQMFLELGMAYEQGRGVDRNLKRAAHYYGMGKAEQELLRCATQLAQEGDPDAVSLFMQHFPQLAEANRAIFSLRFANRSDETFRLLSQAAEKGIPTAFYPLAKASEEKKDRQKAGFFYAKASCWLKAAECYWTDDKDSAIVCLKKLPKHPQALFRLAGLCDNLPERLALLKAAAEGGFLPALHQYSLLLLETQKGEEALSPLRVAASEGFLPACRSLAQLLSRSEDRDHLTDAGDLFRKVDDWKEAEICYQKASLKGAGRANFALAHMQFMGRRLNPVRDFGQILRGFQTAQERGFEASNFYLGLIHKYGLAGAVDQAKANQYFKKARYQPLAHFFHTHPALALFSRDNHVHGAATIAIAIATLDPEQSQRANVEAFLRDRGDLYRLVEAPHVHASANGDLLIHLPDKLAEDLRFLRPLYQLGLVGRAVFEQNFKSSYAVEFRIPKVEVRNFLLEHLLLFPNIYEDLINQPKNAHMMIDFEEQQPFRSQIPKGLQKLFLDPGLEPDLAQLRLVTKDTSKAYPLMLQAFPNLLSIFPPRLGDPTVQILPDVLPGSTGAQKLRYRDVLFIKKNPSPQGGVHHLLAEYHTNKVYRAMGVLVPEVLWYPRERTMLSHFIVGTDLQRYLANPAIPDWKKEKIKALLRRHFVLDCLLANWDVIGLNADNVLVDEQGLPWRIDNGSGFDYRAQGIKKTAQLWSANVQELSSMRDPAINPTSAEIYSPISVEEIQEQIEEILENRHVILDATPENYRKVMEERIADLANYSG